MNAIAADRGLPQPSRAQRRDQRRYGAALALLAPAIAFLTVMFAVPIGYILFYSVSTPRISAGIPAFYGALQRDTAAVPGAEVFTALAAELIRARDDRSLPRTLEAVRIQDLPTWQLLRQTAAQLPAEPVGIDRAWFLGIDPQWGAADTWSVIRRASARYTIHHFLHAVDLQRTADGAIMPRPATERVYLGIFANTFTISFWVAVITLVLGYPLAYYMAGAPPKLANLLLILVLLPFWTSVLVRAYAWIVLLQTNGPLNGVLRALGLISEPLSLVHNRAGVYIAMTHVLLPFMILPIYSVMKTIPPDYIKAAHNLGASPLRAFVRIYFPLTLPGVTAGTLLVFIISLGYYITPAIVGGARDRMISMMIAENINAFVNWGAAAALGTVLLLSTLVIYGLFSHVVRIDRLKAG